MKSKGIHGLSQTLIESMMATSLLTSKAGSLPGPQNRQRSDEPGIWGAGFPVDTHIHRLPMYRWGLSNGKNVVQPKKDAKRLFPKELWNKLHSPDHLLRPSEYSPARGWDLEIGCDNQDGGTEEGGGSITRWRSNTL